MEFVITLTSIMIILMTTLFVRFYRDITAILSSRRLDQALITLAKKRANKPFTIIVTLDHKAKTLFPLLDSLYQQHHASLQIIVIVKRTSGKNASSDLTTYAKQHNMNIKTVIHRAGMSLMDVTRNHAIGTFIMEMESYQRLMTNAIAHLCLEFLIFPKTDVLRMRFSYQPNHTILSGLVAYAQLSTKGPSVYNIYRRRAIIHSRFNVIESSRTEMILPSDKAPQKYRLALSEYAQHMHLVRAIVYIFVTFSAIVTFSMISDTTLRILLSAVALSCLCITSLLRVIEKRRYTIGQITNIVLVAPLSAVFTIAIAITKIVTLRHR